LVESLFAPKMSSANTAVTATLGSYASETVAGSYQVEITQDPSKGRLDANAITHDFANPLSASFSISVDGTTSNLITLSDSYGSAEDLRADLQSRINGDEKLKAAKVAVDVEYDTDTHRFSFVSREYGAVSNVRFTETNGDMGALGIDTTLTGTNGVDVAGTINGVAGFGAGNVLLPALNTDAYGLNLSVSPGAKDQGSFALNFSRGLAGELTNLIDGFMASSGPIGMRQENLQKALDGLDDERTKLDDRMERINTRLLSQFTAMEAIVSSLQRTGESVSGLIDQMPFTASKD
jgi:flagellar hook-associated protein 2